MLREGSAAFWLSGADSLVKFHFLIKEISKTWKHMHLFSKREQSLFMYSGYEKEKINMLQALATVKNNAEHLRAAPKEEKKKSPIALCEDYEISAC